MLDERKEQIKQQKRGIFKQFPYRIELQYPYGKPAYYFVKNVKAHGYETKIRVYLGKRQPSVKDAESLYIEHAFEMEARVAQKKAEFNSKYYHSNYLSQTEIETLEVIHNVFQTFIELLTTNEIDTYEKNFEVAYVQGTTSIEGNTLSRVETFELLEKGVLPKDKTLREINEVQNFKKVKTFRDKYRGKVSLDFIKLLHSLIMDNIANDSAGIFRRTDDIGILGCDLAVTPAILIEKELEDAITEYYDNLKNRIHPFEASVIFHYKFEMIHPFNDGNGRVGREIFNYMLSKSGFPRLLFLGTERDTYIKSLKLGNNNEYSEMIKIFAKLINDQRRHVLMENLGKVVVPPKKKGQLRIVDFCI